jgi:hypothetical protein
VTGTKMQTACGQRNDGRRRTIVRSPPRPTAKVGELGRSIGREAALATWVGTGRLGLCPRIVREPMPFPPNQAQERAGETREITWRWGGLAGVTPAVCLLISRLKVRFLHGSPTNPGGLTATRIRRFRGRQSPGNNELRHRRRRAGAGRLKDAPHLLGRSRGPAGSPDGRPAYPSLASTIASGLRPST